MVKKRKIAGNNGDSANSTSQQVNAKCRRARNKRGSLADLPNMPLDIIIEVMSYLLPLDLLHLARTNKSFRRFLMVRSAAPLWKAARKNVEGLPDCPSFLSEPAYANIAFDDHCHACLKSGIKVVFWKFWARYCPKCKKKWLVSCKEREGCFFSEYCDDGYISYMKDIYRSFPWHHQPEVTELQKVFDKMSDEDREAQKKKVEEMDVVARACEAWHKSTINNRQQEIQQTRERRLQAIISKLRDLGWGEELDHMHPEYEWLRDNSTVKQAKDLTERMWQNMRDEMIRFMERQRQRRLDREKERLWIKRGNQLYKLYFDWWRAQPNKPVLPLAVDIIRRPDMILLAQSPPDQEPDFASLVEQFPDWAEQWRKDRDEDLRNLVRESPEFKDKIPPGVDPLSLAAVVFTCTSCLEFASCGLPSLYPAVLGHQCLYEVVHPFLGFESESREYVLRKITQEPVDWEICRLPWSAKTLELGRWHQRAVEVIKLCGQDPTTVTREQMDALPIRIWCETCEKETTWGPGTREMMRWRDVLAHYRYHENFEHEKAPARLRLLRGNAVNDVLELEKRVLAADAGKVREMQNIYACTHCLEGCSYWDDLEDHLNEAHGIEEIKEEDYYNHPDGEIGDGPSVNLIPNDSRDHGLAVKLDEALARARIFYYYFEDERHT